VWTTRVRFAYGDFVTTGYLNNTENDSCRVLRVYIYICARVCIFLSDKRTWRGEGRSFSLPNHYSGRRRDVDFERKKKPAAAKWRCSLPYNNVV